MRSGSELMKHRVTLLLLTLSVLVCLTNSMARTPQSPQVSNELASQDPTWNEANWTAFLARAEHGDAGAQFWLGAAYEQGRLGKPDLQAALKWFRKAAAQGNPDAQASLGQMYEDGEGVKRNYPQAAKWYRAAAEHFPDYGGAGQGRNQLGLLYLDGRGVPKDYVQAYLWFSVANADRNLADVKSRMTPAQIADAERMANEWKNRHPQP
jgi:uncharacterized protein